MCVLFFSGEMIYQYLTSHIITLFVFTVPEIVKNLFRNKWPENQCSSCDVVITLTCRWIPKWQVTCSKAFAITSGCCHLSTPRVQWFDKKMKNSIRTAGGSSAFGRALRWVLLWLQLCMGESLLACWSLVIASASSGEATTEILNEALTAYDKQCYRRRAACKFLSAGLVTAEEVATLVCLTRRSFYTKN